MNDVKLPEHTTFRRHQPMSAYIVEKIIGGLFTSDSATPKMTRLLTRILEAEKNADANRG